MKKTEKISRWLNHSTLIHGFSTKELGNLSFRTGNKSIITERRKEFAVRLGFNWNDAVIPSLTHSNNIVLIDNKSSLSKDIEGSYLSGGRFVSPKKKVSTVHYNPEWQAGIDGFIVSVPGVFPVILTADCAALALFHPASQIIAIGHVGIIGAINQLPKILIYALGEFCGCNSSELEAVIYPSIRVCHYDLSRSGAWNVIGKNVRAYYGKGNEFYRYGHFDLQGFVKWQLVETGVQHKNICDTNLCTVCYKKDFFSNFRASTSALKLREGRFASVIGTRR